MRRATQRSLLLLAAGGASLGLAGAPPARAEMRRMEAVGAVALASEVPTPVPARQLALEKGLADAVRRVALEVLDPARSGPGSPGAGPAEESAALEAALDQALGTEPRSYATRFRILEDRGARPALFVEDPEVELEYVVVVEVYVDSDRVRRRLQERGLPLAPEGVSPRVWLRLELVDLESYAALAALREALLEGGVGVHAVLPVEMERGRAVLAVDSDREPAALLAQLRRIAPAGLHIDSVASGERSATLRVRLADPPGAEGSAPAPAGIDTPDPDRY